MNFWKLVQAIHFLTIGSIMENIKSQKVRMETVFLDNLDFMVKASTRITGKYHVDLSFETITWKHRLETQL